jgi:transposase
MKGMVDMIVIGADTHKRSHTLVAVDAATGRTRGELEIAATGQGEIDALRFAASLDEERVWAIEDCRHVSSRLERTLVTAGERVVRVTPSLTGPSRKGSRTPGKSDPIDATSVALAAIRVGIDELPAAFLDERAMEIRVLTDYRDQQINERTRQINRLRWHLVRIAPELEAGMRPTSLKNPQNLARLSRQLGRLPRTPQLRIARALVTRIGQITREERDILAELKILIQAHCPALLEQPGCGTVSAAIIIGHTAGAQRFRSDACFARHAGAAPIPASSGNTKRYRLHRGGDRQINRALHTIVLSQLVWDPSTRAYMDKKIAEGKSKLEAIRCLKRHLARRIWRLLYTNTDQPAPITRTTVSVAAPTLMPCTT